MRQFTQDLRRHERILVPTGHTIRVERNGSGPEIAGTISVIGLGGLFLRTRDFQPAGTVLQLKLIDSLVTLESACTVRRVTDNGMGLEITHISPSDEQKLRFLLAQFKA
ncbi:MAG: PilZ domain-containing protein [Candidatus Acidiferrales bacterium]